MKRRNSRLLGSLWFGFVLVFLACMFSLSYLLTGWLYCLAGWHLPGLLVQLINSLLGLLLTGFAAASVGKKARAKGWIPEMQVFGPILQALEQIARGNFSIRLENQFQDNSMVSELAQSVNRMAVELDQMESMRQEFISNVSHEIQSPLTSIRGFAQALEDDTLDAAQRHHYLEIIQAEGRRLSRISDDLLRLASLESDSLRFEPKTYRLDHQIRSLILACEPQWAAKQLEMEAALDELEIRADEDLLSQVWINLLHNSIKFTPPGGRIRVTLQGGNGLIRFRIQDSGPGIPPEDQARIFERFYKVDPSRTRSDGGSGLGLSIASKIVEIHKGTIAVESQPGAGTTFVISLPAV